MTKNEKSLIENLMKKVRRLEAQNRYLIEQVTRLSRVPSEFEGTDIM